jgi:hypothetical protein
MQRDVVVTVPKKQWKDWIAEGDLPGEAPSDMVSHFWLRNLPAGLRTVDKDDRVYVVAHGRLRGYAPLWGFERYCRLVEGTDTSCLMRRGGAVAVTIADPIKGFQGFRYRWWKREDEVPFPDWQTDGVE